MLNNYFLLQEHLFFFLSKINLLIVTECTATLTSTTRWHGQVCCTYIQVKKDQGKTHPRFEYMVTFLCNRSYERWDTYTALILALTFSLICAWIKGCVNNREAGDLSYHRDHHDVTVMCCQTDHRVIIHIISNKTISLYYSYHFKSIIFKLTEID